MSTTRKKAGRPHDRADKVARSRIAALALAPDEYKAVVKAAEVQGVSVSAWLRGTAISASATYLPPNYAATAGAAIPK
jgi:hypothetical protein